MHKALLILFCAVLVIGAGACILLWYGSHIGGPRYNPGDSRDVQKLRVIAENGQPLREALEHYKNDHGTYPMTVDDLFPSYLQSAPIPSPIHWAGWYYQQESTNSYSLYYKLNWDDGLFYEHLVEGTNRWRYAGSEHEVVELTHEFQLR
jgi:hypothetical protein